MRPSLRWILAITVIMSAFALWWFDEPARGTNIVNAIAPSPLRARQVTEAPADFVAPVVSLAADLPRPSLGPSRFDPFVGVVALGAPVQPPPATSVIRPAVVPASPGPVAPALPYRYLGRMVDPAGEQSVYLAKGDTAVAVQVGTRLEEGYVVQAVTADSIHLHFAPLDAHAVIPIPAQEAAPQ